MSKTRKQSLPKVRINNSSISADLSKRSSPSEGRFLVLRADSLAILLIVIGVLLMAYSGLHRYFIWRSLSLSAAQIQTRPEEPQRPAEPSHIFIQWFVDSDIEAMSLVNNEWSISPTKTSYLIQSARPGEAGNIIVYGHNKREILGNIRALKGYEIITITTTDGKAHRYKVSQMKETESNDVSWLQPTTTETLTMYTCSGFLDSKRFLVRALPL